MKITDVFHDDLFPLLFMKIVKAFFKYHFSLSTVFVTVHHRCSAPMPSCKYLLTNFYLDFHEELFI